ncbi:MAG TPA: DMT family transporter [bacterium]|nr:DMT family transporter [bacterium]
MAPTLILIAACLYGISPILAKVAYMYGVTPLVLMTWRVTIAAGLFWSVGLAVRQISPVPVRLAAVLVALGTTLVPIQVFSYFFALSLLPASSASVIVNTSPVHVAWMERLALGERLAGGDLVLLGMIVAGALLVAGATPHAGHPLGLAALGAATIASAAYLIIQRRLVRYVPPFTVMAVIQLCSAVVYWSAGLATGQARVLPPAPAFVAIGASALSASLASLLVLTALRTLAATRTAMLGMLEPVVTVALSVALLNDTMTWARVVGIVTVLAGIAMFYLRLRQTGLGGRVALSGAGGVSPRTGPADQPAAGGQAPSARPVPSRAPSSGA